MQQILSACLQRKKGPDSNKTVLEIINDIVRQDFRRNSLMPANSSQILDHNSMQFENAAGVAGAILENPEPAEVAPQKSRKEKILEYER